MVTCKYIFLFKICALILAYLMTFAYANYYGILVMMFYFSHFCIYKLKFFVRNRYHFSFQLFIQLLIYIWTNGYLFWGTIIQYCQLFIYLFAQSATTLVVKRTYKLAYASFCYDSAIWFSFSFWMLYYSVSPKLLQAHLLLFCPSPVINQLSRKILIPLIR